MNLPLCNELLLEQQGPVLKITLNRPARRNAMNAAMVAELMAVFEAIEGSRQVRAVVLRGAEANFCSGGDISGMQSGDGDPKHAMRAFNRSFGHLISRVNHAPQLVIAVLEGAVMGGGFGLACVADVAIAERGARFGMPEASLGVIPAQIAPFVVDRIGLTHARRLALLAERIDGVEAEQLGLVHHLCEGQEALEQQLTAVLRQLTRVAPNALAETKKLLLDVASLEREALLDRAADVFAACLLADEGQEGTLAFLQKRKPAWAANESGDADE
ncbi:enoyl-CoA hydratase/isomerase family protein [Biformimicrobium ophioploci]|uniref:Isohexenylglutaconyl-CoA hydratase n=1 Tax=Biformimicrobium ophioploci TaxID=3036711 RepID=A0ABQ6LX97_9GAMM|nr:enoyl-CoA hydratase-related protein [Microbulbifer sp. NKW57]GMG86744.1 isohexenylglutaconyl-CoA hydratase [Microbulbifer sp. NKW57]